MTGGKGRAPDHLGDVLGDELLVAGAVLHRADGTVPEGRRRRAESSARVHRLRGHDAEVAGRFSAAVVARTRPTRSPAPESRRPCSLIASTCSTQRSYAQTSTSSSCARLAAKIEPTAPQPTTAILMRKLRAPQGQSL